MNEQKPTPELFDEDEIRAALQGYRADPESFSKSVREKIERQSTGEAEVEKPAFFRRAAAIMPPWLFATPEAATSAKLAGGGTAKGVLSILALPAIFLTMVVMTFFSGISKLRNLRGDQAVKIEEFHRRQREWWWNNLIPVVITIAALIALAIFEPAEAIHAVMLVSMIAMILQIQDLSRFGITNRLAVGTLCFNTLWFLGVYLLMLRDLLQNALSNAAIPSSYYSGIPILFFLGGIFCLVAGNKLSSSPNNSGIPVWVFLLVQIPLLACLTLGGFFGPPVSQEDLVRYARTFDEPTKEMVYWDRFAHVASWVESQQPGTIDFSKVSEKLNLEIESGSYIHPKTIQAALKLNLVNRLGLEILSRKREYQTHRIRGKDGLIQADDYSYIAIYLLTHLEKISDTEREDLAQKLLSRWPDSMETFSLSTIHAICEQLDLLGKSSLADAQKEKVLIALQTSWVRQSEFFLSRVGFAFDLKDHKWPNEETTHYGVELMRRFGVPENVDLYALKTHLERESNKHIGIVFQIIPTVTLEKLLPIVPPKTWAERLLSLRLIFACVLLVALCIFATLRAPHTESTWNLETQRIRYAKIHLSRLYTWYLHVFISGLAIGTVMILFLLGLAQRKQATPPEEFGWYKILIVPAVLFMYLALSSSRTYRFFLRFATRRQITEELQLRLTVYEYTKQAIGIFSLLAMFTWIALSKLDHSKYYLFGAGVAVLLALFQFPKKKEMERLVGLSEMEIDQELQKRK